MFAKNCFQKLQSDFKKDGKVTLCDFKVIQAVSKIIVNVCKNCLQSLQSDFKNDGRVTLEEM